MRKLNTQDVFKAFRLITKSGLKEKLKALIDDVAKNGYDTVEDVGITGLLTALETLTEEKSEQLLYEMLAGPYELTAAEVAALDLETQIEYLKELYKDNNLQSFFIVLSDLLNKKR